MKKTPFRFAFVLTLATFLLSFGVNAQCPFTFNFFGSGTAPTPGNSAVLQTCSFIGEAVTAIGVVAGDNYCVDVTYNSVPGGLVPFVVIYDASFSPIAFGFSPVSFTAPSTGTYYTIPFMDQFCGDFDPSFGCNVTQWTNGCSTPPSPTWNYATECNDYTWPVNNQTYTTSGVYTDSIPNGMGGYDYFNLGLTIIIDSVQLSVSTGPGNVLQSQSTLGNYQWIDCNTNLPISGATNQSFIPTQTGNYAVIISDSSCIDTSGCSFVSIPTTESDFICSNYTWAFNNQTYSSPGTYIDSVPVSGGFQVSTLILTPAISTAELVVVNTNNTLTSQFTGGNYQWIDCLTGLPVSGETSQSFTPIQTGSYAVIISDSSCIDTSGCNFVSIPINQSISTCDDYTWIFNNQTYTTSGVYVDSVPVLAGYQVATLNLTIGFDPANLLVVDSSGTLYSLSSLGNYQWIDCATNLPISGATSQSFSPSQDGSYAVIVSDSICSDTSACTTVLVSGFDLVSHINLSIVPNPTKDLVTISFEGSNANILIYNLQGKTVYSSQVENGDRIDLSTFNAGLYFCKVEIEGSAQIIQLIRQ